VDLKKVCQYVFDSGGVTSTQDGLQINRQRSENISVRHIEVLVPFSHGSGAQLRCVIDTQAARLTDAHVSEGPALNDADMEHIRQKGLCQ
jgi:hypothetical protein